MMRGALPLWVAAATFVLLLQAGICAAADPEPIGKIAALSGDVFAEGPAGRRALKEGAPVFQGESLSTSTNSSCQALFTDGSTLSLSETSRVALNEYIYDPGKAGLTKAVIKLFRGLCRVVTGGIVKTNPKGYTFQTPVANLGIRGTEFFAQIEPDGENLGVLNMDKGHYVEVWTKIDRLEIREAGYFTRVGPDGKLSPLTQIPKNVMNQVMRVQQNMMRLKAVPPRHR
jgi:hypothetical protein